MSKKQDCAKGCGRKISQYATVCRVCWIANKRQPAICACGCGQTVKTIGRTLVRGHYTEAMRQEWSEQRTRNNPMKRPDVAAKVGAKLRGVKRPKVSEWRKRAYADGRLFPPLMTEEFKARASAHMRACNPMKNPETVARMKTTRKANGSDRRGGEATRRFWAENPDFRQRVVERMKTRNPMWDSATKEKSLGLTRQRLSPSKLEQWFAAACQGLPIWFTGTGQFWVEARNPDFKVHGKKAVIEVTDGYSRTPTLRTAENYATPTIAHYRARGFACLVVMIPPRMAHRTVTFATAMVAAVERFAMAPASGVWPIVASSPLPSPKKSSRSTT